ncbi:MAG TPA: hypothetical protein VF599_03505 [Pyrinomonadaceae bacterium]|jgi:predicted permease
MQNLEKMTKKQLEAHLRYLERELKETSRFNYAALMKGKNATIYAMVASLIIFGVSTFAFIQRGEGFVSGLHLVILAFILVGGFIIYFSFVFGRTARIRGEISKTKKLIEMSSGDRV